VADSKALVDLRAGLKAVDDVLSYAKSGVGQPSKKEKSLFVASVALSYAMWENYAEEVAIEVTAVLAKEVPEPLVPTSVRDWIMKMQPPPTAWDLVVHPGWRDLWLQMVRARAKGADGNARDFGILSANASAVRSLFERVGVDPFAGVSNDDLEELDKLVEQRGQIVHTGKAPANFYKKDALDWRAFVANLGEAVDGAIGAEAKKLTGKSPWP
jgi:hypothetical protein